MKHYNHKVDQYLQNMLKFDNMKHKIYEHIINELHDNNLFVIENDLGNPYTGIYVYNLHENLKEFEIIVNKDIENNDFDSATIELIKNQKQEAESLVKSRLKYYQKIGLQRAKKIIRDNKVFSNSYINLYNKISNIIENNNTLKGNDKVALLKKYIKEIEIHLFLAENKYNLSEIAERYTFDIKYLLEDMKNELKKL